MRLAAEPLEQIQKKLEDFLDSYDLQRDWEEASYREELRSREEKLYGEYTDCCLAWYEKWMEFH